MRQLILSPFFRSPRAYSLTELVVSIAILALLTTLLIANFHRGQLADDLRYSAQELASQIRRVQNLSTIGQAYDASGKVPPGGYGINIGYDGTNFSSYVLFADLFLNTGGNPCTTETPSTPVNADSLYNPALDCDKTISPYSIAFRPNITISKVKVGTGTGTVYTPGSWLTGGMNIAFKPPKPIPVINGTVGNTIQVELHNTRLNQSNYRTIIIVGASGQVSERLGQIN